MMNRWAIPVAAVIVAALCGCSPKSPVYRVQPSGLEWVRDNCEYIGTGMAIHWEDEIFSSLRGEINTSVRNMGGNAFHMYYAAGDTRADFFVWHCAAWDD